MDFGTMSGIWTPRQAAQSGTDSDLDALGRQGEALLQRLVDVELAIGVREWWIFGRALPEARLLSEIGSLLAVARGELNDVLVSSFQRPPLTYDPTEAAAPEEEEDPLAVSDPRWLAAARDQALGLLRMVAVSLPAMRQAADILRAGGDRTGMPTAANDGLGIVAGRLAEAYEALQQPPS